MKCEDGLFPKWIEGRGGDSPKRAVIIIGALATLTGACVVALGNNYAGLMGNNEPLKNKIKKASENSWEKVW